MPVKRFGRSLLEWVATIGGGVVFGVVAARYRWLDSTVVVVGLAVLIAALIGLGIRALAEPWTDDED